MPCSPSTLDSISAVDTLPIYSNHSWVQPQQLSFEWSLEGLMPSSLGCKFLASLQLHHMQTHSPCISDQDIDWGVATPATEGRHEHLSPLFSTAGSTFLFSTDINDTILGMGLPFIAWATHCVVVAKRCEVSKA